MSEGDVEAALKQVPFKLGGGKTELSLFEVVPSYAVQVHTIHVCGFSPYFSLCIYDIITLYALKAVFKRKVAE